MANWVTTSAIARQAGVSRATVDRVMNERPGVHPRTIRLVRETAAALPAEKQPKLEVVVRRSASFNAEHAAEAPSAVTDDMSGVLLVAPDAPGLHEALSRFRASGKPIGILASPISGTDGYVETDNRSAGRMAGQLASRFNRADAGTVAVFIGSLSYRGQEEREMSFRTVIGPDAPGLRVETVDATTSDDATMAAATHRLIGQFQELRAIYNAGVGNGGIADALRQAGRDDIVMIGHDLTNFTRELLLEGVMDVAVVQSAESQAREAVSMMGALLRGSKEAPGARILPWEVVPRESLS